MKKKVIFLPLLLIVGVVSTFSWYRLYKHNCDVAIMGPVIFGDGIGRQSIGIIDVLRENYSVGFIKKGGMNLKDVPEEVKKIVRWKYKGTPNVLIFEEPLLIPKHPDFPSLRGVVKIAYSMVESTKIPENWTRILNKEFDAVIVPDEFLVDAYRNSGVTIPIFVLPLGMYLDPFLKNTSLRAKPQDRPFVFGSLGTYIPRKNQATLIKAFAKAFGNDPNVRLVMNGRYGEEEYMRLVQETKQSLGLANVSITSIPLDWKDYVKEIASLDCYVSPSKGEGFSLQPREAMALGIPSIVTDNTAQTTICKSGYVRSVPSNTPVKAFYKMFQAWHDDMGSQYECEVDDLAAALRDVYDHYEIHAVKAIEGRKWVEQYQYDHLQKLYETIVMPNQVILSDRNAIEDGVIYTTSSDLKHRYEKIAKKQNPLRKILNSLIIAVQ